MYEGPERRKNWVYVTENTEYHLHDKECIAVREIKSGRWDTQSPAVGSVLLGGVNILLSGSWKVNFDAGPQVGERLCFSSDLLTTPLRAVRRPSAQTVDAYPARRAAAQ